MPSLPRRPPGVTALAGLFAFGTLASGRVVLEAAREGAPRALK
jgi:NADPH-dependent curcumin reductase CurA